MVKQVKSNPVVIQATQAESAVVEVVVPVKVMADSENVPAETVEQETPSANANANANAEVITTPVAASKAEKARAIFGEVYAMQTVPARKDIINRAVNEAGLTKAGAATYLQNYKSTHGLTKKR